MLIGNETITWTILMNYAQPDQITGLETYQVLRNGPICFHTIVKPL
jgi:hypothetical protein